MLKSRRAGVTGACGCWQLNSGPLQEEQAHLATEPSLALNFNFENNYVCLLVTCRVMEFSIFGYIWF